jgi:hypothetical protein
MEMDMQDPGDMWSRVERSASRVNERNWGRKTEFG